MALPLKPTDKQGVIGRLSPEGGVAPTGGRKSAIAKKRGRGAQPPGKLLIFVSISLHFFNKFSGLAPPFSEACGLQLRIIIYVPDPAPVHLNC